MPLPIDIDGPNAKKACDSPARTVQATLRQVGVGDWLGTMQGKFPEDPTRFELVSSAQTPGIAKTPFGWFSLQDVRLDNDTLRLTIAANNQLPPTLDDIRIIERAEALLSNEESWNRADDRTCPSNPQKWSLFCALEQATQEVSGGVHYRQPALQMAREVLNDVGGAVLWTTTIIRTQHWQKSTLCSKLCEHVWKSACANDFMPISICSDFGRVTCFIKRLLSLTDAIEFQKLRQYRSSISESAS